MSDTIAKEIIRGLQEAIAHQRGELPMARAKRVPITARVAESRAAPQYTSRKVAKLRARLGLSQAVMASALNVSRETVRAWEQGKRHPDGAALRLLQIADRHPAVILEQLAPRTD